MSLDPPKGSVGHRRALTEKEREIFMQVVPKHHRGALFALMLACGLRPGEVRALTWGNVDMTEKTVTISQAIEAGSTNIKPPKTEAGNRTIPIPDWYMEISTKCHKIIYLIFSKFKR